MFNNNKINNSRYVKNARDAHIAFGANPALVSKVITGSQLDSVAKIDRYIFILNCTISSSHMYMS